MIPNPANYILSQPLRNFTLLSFLILTFLTGYATPALAAQITGSILLPSGETAPVGGLDVNIEFYDVNGGNSDLIEVTILEGNPSEVYTIIVPDDINASWLVNYSYSGNDYLKYGYFASSGTTWDQNEATLLDGGQDHADIDMTLLTGNTITGIVSLPTGQVAPAGGLAVGIKAFYDDYSDVAGSSSMVIPGGSSSGTYTLKVRDDTNAFWRIKYICGSTDYLQNGYYASSGTTWDQNSATPLAGGQDHADIDITLLTGNTISGTVSLPSGQAPAGGIQLDIGAFNTNQNGGGGSIYVTILETSSSADYTLRVPDNVNASWLISYSYQGTDYRQLAYYASGGTTGDSNGATLLTGGQDYTGVDMTLLTGKTITGSISLPSGQTAPAGGLDVEIYAFDSVISGYTTVTIPENSPSAVYTLRVPDDVNASWRIDYIYRGSGYRQYGYYSSSGTTEDPSGATLLTGGQDYTGIDMELLPENTISGTISLPPGQTAPAGGFQVFINVDYDNGIGGGLSSIIIAEGNPSATYTVRVPDTNASWQVSYSYYDNSNYLQCGYYTSNGTTGDSSGATLLAGGQDYTGIDMVILRADAGTFPWNMFLPTIIGRAMR